MMKLQEFAKLGMIGAVALGISLLAGPALAQPDGGAAQNRLAAVQAEAASPVGDWLTAKGNAVVRIAPCGPDLCGRIVGLAYAPNQPAPRDWVGAPQCGLTIFRTAPSGGDSGAAVWTGSILDPRSGAQYGAQLHLAQPGDLQLRGYVGLPLFGETQTWHRFDGATAANCRLQTPTQ
jgi:uncharacterized protein (DUF2147 family)